LVITKDCRAAKKKKKKKKKEKKAGADLVANSRGLAPSLGDEHVYE